jgi:hypothetical protein
LSTDTRHVPAEPASPIAVGAACALALLAVLFLIWPVWRAALPLEIWPNGPNEGWNAYQIDAAFTARLYPQPDGLSGNNYPPLSFYLIGALGALFGDALHIGRALSLIATIVVGLCAAGVVLRFNATRMAAVLAGLWFVATMARFFDSYVGMNEPQLLAHAIMNVGLVWFLARMDAGRPVEPAVLLMVLAGFVKHNIIGVPLVALLWLARDNWRLALRAALIGGAVAAAGLAILAHAYPNFVADMLQPRAYYLQRSLDTIGRTQFVLPALVVWAIWAWTERATRAVRFTTLLIATSLATYFIQKSSSGVDENAQFELVFASAIGVGLAFDRLSRNPWPRGWPSKRVQLVIVVVLLVRLLASTRFEFAYVVASPEYRALGAEHAKIARAEAARVAAVPAPVVCSNVVVCRMAGKPYVFDHYKVSQMIETRNYSQEQIADKARAAGIVFETVDPRAKATSLYQRYPR